MPTPSTASVLPSMPIFAPIYAIYGKLSPRRTVLQGTWAIIGRLYYWHVRGGADEASRRVEN